MVNNNNRQVLPLAHVWEGPKATSARSHLSPLIERWAKASLRGKKTQKQDYTYSTTPISDSDRANYPYVLGRLANLAEMAATAAKPKQYEVLYDSGSAEEPISGPRFETFTAGNLTLRVRRQN